jgi:hypothetical protein
MAVGIPRILSAFNISCMKCWSVVVVVVVVSFCCCCCCCCCCFCCSQTLQCRHIQKKVLSLLILWFYFAFSPQDMKAHSVLSLLASSHCNNLTENSSCTANFNYVSLCGTVHVWTKVSQFCITQYLEYRIK